MLPENAKAIVAKAFGQRGVDLLEGLMGEKPSQANAIVFLQGDQLDRAPAVQLLYEQGFARNILISGNNVLVGSGKRPDENDYPLFRLHEYLVSRGVPAEAITIEDESMNSKEQVVHIVSTAREQKWSGILVVVSAYHLLRAYLAFVRQIHEQGWEGKITMYGVNLAWDKAPAGRTKTALEMLEIEMEKITQYAKDIASIEEGLDYYQKNH